ncbi:hypothetical protein Sulku_1692 [Sulfuricurvum kujiense DSM 16994]|uniref:pEK499-p136 HEPN domain-containing protein n=1 Tax=Sulfuricurvum kujiense (strain ATCC BAA-921 / DSM 16994 / JCM 11577 / YK-1) TaxID=709032 RepID=E4U0N6_SULKY|nr:HEPN family nuclease [Sulfuricurvum kujiense]ADR34353.1 hypothetical protein Sulku_1692 [Sulfuricurvum kujiense DSM 16994]
MGHYPEEKSEFIREFFKRTLHNLHIYLEDQQNSKFRYPYDVTQTINSFLGLIVFLQDSDIVFTQELEDFVEAHLPIQWTCFDGNNGLEEHNFRNYLKRLRNAVSHRKIKSIPDQNNEIMALEFRDGKNGGCFCAKLSVESVNLLITLLSRNILGAQ